MEWALQSCRGLGRAWVTVRDAVEVSLHSGIKVKRSTPGSLMPNLKPSSRDSSAFHDPAPVPAPNLPLQPRGARCVRPEQRAPSHSAALSCPSALFYSVFYLLNSDLSLETQFTLASPEGVRTKQIYRRGWGESKLHKVPRVSKQLQTHTAGNAGLILWERKHWARHSERNPSTEKHSVSDKSVLPPLDGTSKFTRRTSTCVSLQFLYSDCQCLSTHHPLQRKH